MRSVTQLDESATATDFDHPTALIPVDLAGHFEIRDSTRLTAQN